MKKLFSLALLALFSVGLWAADVAKISFNNDAQVTNYGATKITATNSTVGAVNVSWADFSISSQYVSSTGTKENSIVLSNSVGSAYDTKYVQFSSANIITKVELLAAIPGSTSGADEVICGWTGTPSDTPDTIVTKSIPGKGTTTLTMIEFPQTKGIKYVRCYRQPKFSNGKFDSKGTNTGSSSTWAIAYAQVTTIPSCDDAENKGTFTAEATNLVITPSVASPSTALTFTKGDNKSNPEYAVTKGDEATADATVVDGVFTATAAGTYKVTATQDVDETNNICEVIKELTITVTAEIPVSACTISGSATGFIGQELTYTAEAANATDFEWYVDGVNANTNDAEFTYIGVKGSHSIVAKARNQFNEEDEWIASEPIALTVTKVCGELISYTAKTKSSGSYDDDFEATGVIGGTVHQKGERTGKINSGGYYSLQLTSGSFMVGDVVSIYVTPEDNKVPATLILASDKANTDIIGSVSGLTVDNTNPAQITLTKGTSIIYLSRDGTVSGQNPIVSRISVSRPCEESSNANIAELTINGDAVEAVENVYSYTVAATVDLAQVAVAFSLAHPLASADKESPFNITVPAGGDPAYAASITVTAEDGTEATYTISVSKSAAASTDATLKNLKIDGADVADFAAATLEYSKEYEYDYTAVPVVSAEANDANATVNIDQAEAVPGIATITVTAEDGETQEVYTVNLKKEAVAPIIRATSTGNTTATISGTIGGTSAKSTQGDKFGGKGNYWGLTLNGDNTFKTGDTLHVIISQAAQQGTIALYDDQDGANLIYNTEALGVVGDNVFVFPAAMNGKKTFYICRDKAETNKWNAFVTSISVKRKATATAISNTSDAVKAQKRIENGQLVIEKNGKVFNAMGQTIR